MWLRHAPALPGCGARIVPRFACTLRPLPLLRLAASAAGGARLCSSLRFPTVTKKYVLMPDGDSNALFCSIGIASVGTGPPLAMYFKISFYDSLTFRVSFFDGTIIQPYVVKYNEFF